MGGAAIIVQHKVGNTAVGDKRLHERPELGQFPAKIGRVSTGPEGPVAPALVNPHYIVTVFPQQPSKTEEEMAGISLNKQKSAFRHPAATPR
jgi:hypothetical protein